ncbi:activating signal cointegrator 1 isoform X2 [Impatiens glandulifera]|uniref:activating signal cointegrator 1 isoform X2 n=1 Tax=Impatiens glandulifera TaxID=253017 RepID=UPI001FB186F2|nr:activating signal cointegrator 1 isoform X2 [Impatiens glandulifera]
MVKSYQNIIGQEIGKTAIEEYLKRRGYHSIPSNTSEASTSRLQAYVKPPSNELVGGNKKPVKALKDATVINNQEKRVPTATNGSTRGNQKENQNNSRKKKSGKVISLAEAAKGSIVFQKGKPCSCQARSHRLVSNCLSCGKIVCEQEGEGPCHFCGALVLKEGSTYAGLDEGSFLLNDAEAAAEAYAKRLVDYDRNSAARTTVIDDQSDYYEIDSNSWLSIEEKELLKKKKEEIEQAELAMKSKVKMSFDLVGRKVLINEDDTSELETNNHILRPLKDREINRIKPNPFLEIQPVYIDPGNKKRTPTKRENSKNNKGSSSSNMCFEISGRVQHDQNDLKRFIVDSQQSGETWGKPATSSKSHVDDDKECSLDYD